MVSGQDFFPLCFRMVFWYRAWIVCRLSLKKTILYTFIHFQTRPYASVHINTILYTLYIGHAQDKSGRKNMPLTRKVAFKASLQKHERIQIPKLIIVEFKLESHQTIKVGFSIPDKFKGWQFYYAKMEKAGRISIPKEILSVWQDERANLPGCIVEVTLEPV